MKTRWFSIMFLSVFAATGWCFPVDGPGYHKDLAEYYKGMEVYIIPHTETLWTINDCRRYSAGMPEVVKCDAVFGGPCYMQNGRKLTIEDMDRLVDDIKLKQIAAAKQAKWDDDWKTWSTILGLIIFVPIGISVLRNWDPGILEEAAERELKYGKGIQIAKDIKRTPPELENFLDEMRKMNRNK